MDDLISDVAVIGAGTAGLAAERAARKAGAKTLLIDDGFSGTTCARVGCMPSKLLIAAGEAAHNARRASIFGIASPVKIDGVAVMSRVRKERDAFVEATLRSITDIPPDIRIDARARFAGPTDLQLSDGRRVAAKTVVIATGARPSLPDAFKELGDRILTNETVFELNDLPASIAVVGAGPLGIELAQAFARLGVDTHVFDSSDHLAALRDAQIADEVRSVLSKEFTLHLGVKLDASKGSRCIHLTWSGPSSGSRTFDYVLVAAGRPAAFDGLALNLTSLERDDKGIPRFDPNTLQCGDTPIFIAGDADGTRPVLHEASFEGYLAGRNAACFPNVERHHRMVPVAIVFTDPPIAVIGEPPNNETVTGEASYLNQGRAKVEARNEGRIRIYAEPRSGKITGATLFGPAMDHIAHLLAWSIERGETAETLMSRPFYHPMIEEGIKPALRDICAATSGVRQFDEGSPSGA